MILEKKFCYLFLTLFLIARCGKIVPGTGSGADALLINSKKNISRAEAIEDINRKKELLNTALAQIERAESIIKKSEKPSQKADKYYAYYYFVKGDYKKAKEYAKSAISSGNKQDDLIVLDTRIRLKSEGKKFADKAIRILKGIINRKPNIAMAELTLGDSYFYKVDYIKARKHYKNVLFVGGMLQVLAAERLEILNEIEKIQLNPKKFQNIIFSKSLRRDETAYLLHKVYKIGKKLRFPVKREVDFSDLSKSIYADSIRSLTLKGMFSYIKGSTFEPLKNITKKEMAKIVEDYIVLSSGNKNFRTIFTKSKKSPIKDVDPKDPFYNAVRIAVKEKIINLTLSGLLNPEEPVNGLEALTIIKKMTKKKFR